MDAETRKYLEDLKESTEETNETVKILHDKFFVGNGQPPITVQIDRLNIFRIIILWLFAPLYLGAIGLLSRLIHSMLTK